MSLCVTGNRVCVLQSYSVQSLTTGPRRPCFTCERSGEGPIGPIGPRGPGRPGEPALPGGPGEPLGPATPKREKEEERETE